MNLALNPQLGWAHARSLDMQAQPASTCSDTRRGATCATQPASASLHQLHRPTVVTAVVPYARYTHPAMHASVEAEAKSHTSKD